MTEETLERMIVADVVKSNGAWLISIMGHLAMERTDEENYDCAASISVAKRVAKDNARELGYSHLMWKQQSSDHWYLLGIDPKQ